MNKRERIAELEKGLRDAQLRIGRLENPPNFAVGNVIKVKIPAAEDMCSPHYTRDGVKYYYLPNKSQSFVGKITRIEYERSSIYPEYTVFSVEKEDIFKLPEAFIFGMVKEEPKHPTKKKK